MKKLTKSKKITIITVSLAVLLVALALVWVFVIKPLTDKGEENPTTVVTPQEGEGTYYGNLSLYPSINVKDVISLTVTNEHETIEFISRLDPDTVTRQLRLAAYPTVKLSDEALANLRVPTLIAMCTSNTPLRDLTEEQMVAYGVTEETCTAKWTIKYYAGVNECEQTVYVGDKSPNAVSSYFVAVKGRNVVYELGSLVKDGLFVEKEAFVNASIQSIFSDTEAVYNVKRIMIGYENADLPFIAINATKQEFEDSLVIKHTVVFPSVAAGVAADSNYIADVFTKVLVNFSGDKVVAIAPNEETKAKYGLGKDDQKKIIYIDTFGEDGTGDVLDLGVTISNLILDENNLPYYYILASGSNVDSVPIIVRLPAIGYEFLEESNAVKWVATNSIDAGFSKYIYANEQEGESGVETIEIMANTNALKGFHDKFFLSSAKHPENEEKTILSVTSQSGLYTFVSDPTQDSSNQNQFNNFYAMLVNYPMPNRFNTMSDEQRAEVKKQENLVLSIRVKMKDGAELGYDYYKIDSANVMCEFFDEKNPDPRIVFDTTNEHINILATALKQLISGEQVERK